MKMGVQLLQRMAAEDFLRDFLLRIRTVIDNGHLGFGDGVTVDNMYGVWVNYTTNAVANTEDALVHGLGVVPIGFITVSLDKGAVLYKGTTTWTNTTIYLKCSLATTVARIFILGPSSQGS